MYVTEQLRDIEAGVMQIGSWADPLGHFIPPGLSYAHNQAFTDPNCTKAVIPESGINIFANVLHQHTLGVASTLRRVRDGVETEPVDSNWNYEFSFLLVQHRKTQIYIVSLIWSKRTCQIDFEGVTVPAK